MKQFLVTSIVCCAVACGCAAGGSSETPEAPPVDHRDQRGQLGPLAPPSLPDLASGKQKPPTFDELGGQLQTAGEHWMYSDGLGKTMLNVGAVVLFPPYAIYLVGNAGLALFGQDPLYVSDLLPEEPREGYLTVYDAVTSVPGVITSTIAGEEFRAPKRLQ